MMSANITENPYREENSHADHNHEENQEGINQFFQFLVGLKPDALISYNVGSGVFFRLKELGIKMYIPKGHTVKENIDALKAGVLTEIREPSEG